MKIQLWSYNYDPEPTGIGPLSRVWCQAMAARGHDVSVIAARAHYPEPRWGRPWLPSVEVRDGIRVTRLPLWPGRRTTAARLRQEVTFTTALAAASSFLGSPDVIVAVSPSFPALSVAMANARARRIPWVLWLQDILPDGANATGLLSDGALLRTCRQFERAAYRSAARVVVISDSFGENLREKGVPDSHIKRIYNPASLPIQLTSFGTRETDPRLVVTMGNIGHTQNLVEVVRAFERDQGLRDKDARFVIIGCGVAADSVRSAIQTERVQITGVLDPPELDSYLRRASVAVVSQSYQGRDFNVPSKLMNFMGYGIATVADVRADSEVAHLINSSSGGWVVNGSDGLGISKALNAALEDRDELRRRGTAAQDFARENFTPEWTAAQFDRVLADVTGIQSFAQPSDIDTRVNEPLAPVETYPPRPRPVTDDPDSARNQTGGSVPMSSR